MRKVISFILIIAINASFFFGCAKPSQNADVGTPSVEQTPPVGTPIVPASPEPTPIAELSPYAYLPAQGPIRDWNYTDGGLDGVGTVIGNTNGNMARGGLAVENAEKTHFYYYVEFPDSFSDESHILEYNKKTETLSLVFECGDDRMDYPYLNFLNGKLWFANRNKMYSYDPENGKLAELLSLETSIDGMYAGYGYIYIYTAISPAMHETLCYDIVEGQLSHRIGGFSIENLMDGRVYGFRIDADGAWQGVSMTPDDRNVEEGYAGNVVADGKSYWWSVGEGEWPEDGDIYVCDMHSGEIRKIELPDDFFCYDLVNLSRDYIYVKDWIADDWGYVYAIRISDGKCMGRISDCMYYYEGFSILDGRPEWEVIPYQRGTKIEDLH
ncbi:MAG: hypothetical protein FWF10_03500 [Clostridiales bacterium]|nr:hypothetical protein [Clostridiales bacterium]